MLQQEKYTGIYTFNGETFTHIYPAVIPKELFQTVRKRINKNKTGKHVIGVDYILMGKCYCGYCGRQPRSAAGTTTDGTILRYYRCPYSKKDPDCHNKSVRKEALEEIVTNVLAEELTKSDNLKILTDKVFELYCAKTQDDSDLHRYEKELAATDKAIKNILAAIEEGIFTPSTKQRLTELGEKKHRLEQALTVESAKEKNLLTKEDIERYITAAVKLSAKQMVELLVERIDIYIDKICIKLKYTDTPPDFPSEHRDDLSETALTSNDDNLATSHAADYSIKQSDNPPYTNDRGTSPEDATKKTEYSIANARGDRKNSCRRGLVFTFSKSHTISRPHTYKSGRTRIYTCTTTFIIELYI